MQATDEPIGRSRYQVYRRRVTRVGDFLSGGSRRTGGNCGFLRDLWRLQIHQFLAQPA